MDTLKTLKAVRDLFADPTHWTQCSYAKDPEGKHISAFDPTAVCWCVLGAVRRFSRDADENKLVIIKMREANAITFIGSWNDERSRTHQDILDMLDNTIAYVKGE